MADKKDKKEKKIILERVYNVPLRKKYQRAPRWKRTNRAVSALREFIVKHMKGKEVKIGKYANLELWKNGMKNPPHHIKVVCKKDEDGVVKVEIEGAPVEKPKEAKKVKKKETKEKKAEVKDEEAAEIKVKDALGGEDVSDLEKDLEDKKEKQKEKAKEIQKEEIKELKEEQKKKVKKAAPKPVVKENKVEQHPNAPMKKG